MKKIAKIAVGITLAASLAATAGALAGCGDAAKTGEAYGLVHSGGYVGYAKITVKGDNVTDLTLTEVCLPTQVTAGGTVADADKVVVGTGDSAKAYYKTVSYGSVTLTYDADNGYMVGTQKLAEYLNTEANAKAYYEAVTSNAISVTVGGEKKTDIMNKATLSKEENGYWTRKDKDGKDFSRWKWNRDATVNYVKANGLAKLSTLVKSETNNGKDPADADVKMWVDGNGIVTGATWNDLNPTDKKGKTYFTYAELITAANTNATK